MSRTFSNAVVLPFLGGVSGSQQISACAPSKQPPACISLDIDWRLYGNAMNIPGGTAVFSGAVSFDLTRGVVQQSLDIVKSVFIDNTATERPVYLRCEDTGHVITCSDFGFGWFPLITNGEQFTLFTDNVVPLRDGSQRTRLIFSNAPYDTFGGSEYNRAQPLYQASGKGIYATPALGELSISGRLDFNSGGSIQLLPKTAKTRLIITGVQIQTAHFTRTTSSPNATCGIHSVQGSAGQIVAQIQDPKQTTANRVFVPGQSGIFTNMQVAFDLSASALFLVCSVANPDGDGYSGSANTTVFYSALTS